MSSVPAAAPSTTMAPMTANKIPCCLCGTMILPNAANQCGTCLAQQFDLKSILQRGPGGAPDIVVHQCRRCRRFERSTNGVGVYAEMDLESPELLSLCLKKIPALNSSSMAPKDLDIQKIHLVDAMWVWTEPHSMRLKVRLTVRADVIESPRTVTIQQRVLVELVIRFKPCPECNREFTNRTWHALIQLRQKRNDDAPRKGLILLEMALARNAEARKYVLSMDTSRQGFDFYFLTLAQAQAFAGYLAKMAPLRIRTSQKLVSTDVKNNTANMKHTVTCDMVPLCRDDLVIVDKQMTCGKLSGRLCLVTKVSSVVHLVDASPARDAVVEKVTDEVPPEKYYKAGGEKAYRLLSSSKRMTRFVVLDVELQGSSFAYEQQEAANSSPVIYQGPQSRVEKYAIADVELARESDFGTNDETFRSVTHLGHLLQVGDLVLGYDLASSVLSGGAEWSVDNSFNSHFVLPDVVLVKKVKGGNNDKMEEDETDERPKSGVSKKRERRRHRKEKKMRELEAAAARMGFLEDGDDDLAPERAQFEDELANDPGMARDLELAERELKKAGGQAGSQNKMASNNESGED